MSEEPTQTPPSAQPKPGQPGYKPSRATLKMQAGRRAKNEEKKKREAAAAAARSGAQGRAPAPPSSSSVAVPDKMKKKIVEYVVKPAVVVLESSGFFMARRLTAPAVPLGEPDAEGRRFPTVTEVEYAAMVVEHRKNAWAEDRLEEWEKVYLAEELTDELVRYPRVRAFLIQCVAIAERGGLPTAIAVIMAPRLVRHGVIPAELRELSLSIVEEARKRRGVTAEPSSSTASSNGAGEAPSPHFTEPAAV